MLLLINDVHPTLHSFLADSSDPDANSLNICVFVAFLGSSYMSRLQVCINFIVLLLGTSISIPLLVISTF